MLVAEVGGVESRLGLEGLGNEVDVVDAIVVEDGRLEGLIAGLTGFKVSELRAT